MRTGCRRLLVLLGSATAIAGVVTGLVGVGLAAWCWRPLPAVVALRVQPPAHYTVHGIDVSHHQGTIDWPLVAAHPQVDFAFVKATEGTHHVDRRFATNWSEARAAGLPVGAYHYFSLCRTGADQAAHFNAVVPVTAEALPPVLDIEPDARCNRQHRYAQLDTELTAFLDAVQAHHGVRPIVYTSASFFRDELAALDLGAPLWVASYTRAPRTDGHPWIFWQYSDRAIVPGIHGPVDRNVFVGSPSGLSMVSGGARAAR